MAMSDESLPAAGLASGPGARRPPHRFSLALASVICERIAAGETLLGICQDLEMPSRFSVLAWTRPHPSFGERLAQAWRGGWHNPRGGWPQANVFIQKFGEDEAVRVGETRPCSSRRTGEIR